jgi:hypothetical protein
MAETNFRGPVVSMGSLEDTSSSPVDGPSILYQGVSFPDPRYSPLKKDGTAPARVPGFFMAPSVVACDLIPMIGTTNLIATTALVTTSTVMTLISTALGGADNNVASIAPGMPLIPFNQSAIVTVMALEFGFATGTTTAGSSTVVVTDSSIFRAGGWYAIGGAGNAGKTAGLITQITTIANATTFNISPVAVGSLTRAPIGNANVHGTGLTPPASQFVPAVTANAVAPYAAGGMGLLFDATQGASRTLALRQTTVTTGGSVTVAGYDVFGVAISETLTGNGTTTFGKKAFKYVVSVTPSTTSPTATATFEVGIGDVFGFPVRADKGAYLTACYGTTFLTSTNGFTAAITGVSTATTGDVRGTLQISTAGALGTSFVAPLINGTSRLMMVYDLPMNNVLFATSTATASLFGVPQV